MKKIITTLCAVLVAGSVLVSCGNSSKGTGNTNSNTAGTNNSDADIKAAAIGFINAMNHVDMQKAKTLVTDSSKVLMDQMVEKMKSMSDDDKKFIEDQKANADKITITVKDVKTTGNDALVIFFSSAEPDRPDTIYLQKESGAWLTDMKRL